MQRLSHWGSQPKRGLKAIVGEVVRAMAVAGHLALKAVPCHATLPFVLLQEAVLPSELSGQ